MEKQKSVDKDVHWETVNKTLIVASFGEIEASDKICSFDMDSTLTVTKGKHTFMKNGDDWQWWNKKVPIKL